MRAVICGRDDLAIGEKQRFVVGRRAVVVGRIGDDEWFAVRDVCPHLGAELSAGFLGGTQLPCDEVGEYKFGREREVLRCPWHGYEFSVRTGEQMFISSSYRIKTYPATLEGGRVVVDMS